MTRIITSLIGIPILVYLIKFAPVPAFVAAVFIAMILCLYEYFILTRIHTSISLAIAGYIMAGIIFFSFYEDALTFYIPVSGGVILMAGLFSKLDFLKAFQATAFTLFGSFYVGGLLGYLVGMRLIDPGGEMGADLVMTLFIIIWAGDIFAYLIGKKFGRHKLSAVSPKKTVEGAVAGLIFSILLAAVCRYFFIQQLTLLHSLILGGLVGLAGQFGDLCESLLKRSMNVKDSGLILPGHGGMLDRLDSLLFGAPAMYYYFYLVLHS